MAVIFFLIIISLLVFVHEWGHFLAARRLGVAVEEFGFGFPPRVWSVQRGPTTWSINLIPFGGFVKLQGEHDDATARPDSFISASQGKKFAIIAAGVVMNYIFAWLLFSTALAAGVTTSQAGLPTDRWHHFISAGQILAVGAGSSAAKAGIQSGDTLDTINNQHFSSTAAVVAYVAAQNYPPLTIRYVHDGQTKTAEVTPNPTTDHQPRYGLGVETTGRLSYPWFVAPWYGLKTGYSVTSQTLVGLGQIFQTLVTQGKVSGDVTGPIGIAVLTKQVTQLGFVALIQFTAIISTSLAVLNFLPIPALDGGRALFIVIESIRGRPVNRRVEAVIHTASFYALLIFIFLISLRDVQRFDIVSRLQHVFQ